jgi:hypothetical protein
VQLQDALRDLRIVTEPRERESHEPNRARIATQANEWQKTADKGQTRQHERGRWTPSAELQWSIGKSSVNGKKDRTFEVIKSIMSITSSVPTYFCSFCEK